MYIFIVVFLGHHFFVWKREPHQYLWTFKESCPTQFSTRKMEMDLSSLRALIQILSLHDFTSDWVHQGWAKVNMRWSYLQLCGVSETCEPLKLQTATKIRPLTYRQLDKCQGHVPSFFCKNATIWRITLWCIFSEDFGDLKMEGIVSWPELGFVCLLFVGEGAVGWEAKERRPSWHVAIKLFKDASFSGHLLRSFVQHVWHSEADCGVELINAVSSEN